MSLNLSSLKNLSPLLIDASGSGNIVPPPKSLPEISTQEKIPATGPKISLMKLKKASGMESPILSGEESTKKEISVEQATKEEEVTDILVKKEMIVAIPPSIESLSTEAIARDSMESHSIIVDDETMEEEKVPSQEMMEAAEIQEFFPNFQIMDKMQFDEDLVDLQDFITIKEHEEQTSHEEVLIVPTIEESISPINETLPADVPENIISSNTIEENSPVLECKDVKSEESALEIVSAEIVPEEPSDTSIVATHEYVAEVKTELSEQRRAGFRFFVQKKTKIMAGISLVVFSAAAMTLLSHSFLAAGIQKSGKSNIQEVVLKPIENNKGPDVEVPTPVTPPVVETSGYEMGRDYSVTKNTKKNIRTKTSSGISIGGESPTP